MSPRLLTVRQAEVLDLIVLGLTNDGIARELGVKPRTVKAHVENLRRIAGVQRKRELIRWAHER